MEWRRNTVIYKQGDEPDYVYIIKEGDFDFHLKINHNLKPQHNFLSIYSDEPQASRFRCNSPLSYPAGVNRLDPQNFKCAQLGKGSIFGEHEVVNRCTRKTTVKWNSTTAKLLRISAKDFVTVIKQIFPKTLSLISKSPEGITDLVDHFLQNKREVEIPSKIDPDDYDDKIEALAGKYNISSDIPRKESTEKKEGKTITYAQMREENLTQEKQFSYPSAPYKRPSSRAVRKTIYLDDRQLIRGVSKNSDNKRSGW